jgi:hypothetical protein
MHAPEYDGWQSGVAVVVVGGTVVAATERRVVGGCGWITFSEVVGAAKIPRMLVVGDRRGPAEGAPAVAGPVAASWARVAGRSTDIGSSAPAFEIAATTQIPMTATTAFCLVLNVVLVVSRQGCRSGVSQRIADEVQPDPLGRVRAIRGTNRDQLSNG